MDDFDAVNRLTDDGREHSFPAQFGEFLSWSPDQQRVGYRRMRELFPHDRVRSGSYVRPLDGSGVELDPRWNADGRELDVASYMALNNCSGVVVLRNAAIVLERYAAGRTGDDLWASMSIAKSVTAILVGMAIDEGLIAGADTKVTDLLPELLGSAYDGVTMRHLLTMTSGVGWSEDYADPRSNVTHALDSPLLNYMGGLTRVAKPGTRFVYNTGDTDLAGAALAVATGVSPAEYLSRKLWIPYGMEADAYWRKDGDGLVRGGAGLSARLRDFARIGQFMLDGGVSRGERLLSAAWIADSAATHVTFPPRDPSEEGWGIGYGYFWWKYEEAFVALGHSGQAIFVYPGDELVIAINSTMPEPNPAADWRSLEAFAAAVRAAARDGDRNRAT